VLVQRLLTLAKVVGILAIVGLGLGSAPPAAASPATAGTGSPSFGLAMVLVLLTYGGWNEAAYISAELKSVRRNMLATLVLGVGAIVVLYLLVNLAYVRVLGVRGMAASSAVAVDLVRATLGQSWCCALGALVSIAVLGSMNATVFTGGRSAFALGADVPLLGALSRWSSRGATPRPALIAQGSLTLLLVLLGSRTRDGFQAMVDYTAPVFWFFFLMVGLSLFVLRRREPRAARPFRVPLYPLTPAAFCAACGYMLYSSITYAAGEVASGQGLDGVGAFAGIGILLLGIPVVLSARVASRASATPLRDGEVA
jgi:amino acid transporter